MEDRTPVVGGQARKVRQRVPETTLGEFALGVWGEAVVHKGLSRHARFGRLQVQVAVYERNRKLDLQCTGGFRLTFC